MRIPTTSLVSCAGLRGWGIGLICGLADPRSLVGAPVRGFWPRDTVPLEVPPCTCHSLHKSTATLNLSIPLGG